MMKKDLTEAKNIYFLGIGGIGMSALAEYLHARGKNISGYDKTPSEITAHLQKTGIAVHFDENPLTLSAETEYLIYTPAVQKTHLLFQEAIRRNIQVLKRAEALEFISKEYKCIAVAGTHGKTTTSTLISLLLREGGIDCTAFLGGISLGHNTNLFLGKSEWLVVEADEFDRSFHHLDPFLSVITSMDPDHLDVYGNYQKLKISFRKFARKTNPKGKIFYCADHLALSGMMKSFPDSIPYSVSHSCEYHAVNVRFTGLLSRFDIYRNGKPWLEDVVFTQPGRHNIENAVAAVSVADTLGIGKQSIKDTLVRFRGVKRRFEVKVHGRKHIYIDDYAHHPAEIRAFLESLKDTFPGKRTLAIFQPHLYSRTRDFYKEFGEALSLAGSVILLPVYPAREIPISGITSDMILPHLSVREKSVISLEDVVPEVSRLHRDKEVIVTIGAGDIDSVTEKMTNEILKW